MSGTALKLIALALMLVDHIGEFIPGVPIWFRWIGRLSAPIFFYCAAQGLAHTRSRKKYLLRLYIFSLCMAGAGLLCNALFPQSYSYINNNIFATIFAFGVVVTLIELWLKDKKRGGVFIALYILVQLAALAATGLLGGRGPYGMPMLAGAVLGSAVLCEGGPVCVLLCAALYWARDDKRKLAAAFLAFSMFFFFQALSAAGGNLRVVVYQDFQWMMVLALPLMLAYNGKRGAGLKYLFYFFYPAHIFALFFIGNALWTV